MDGIEQAFSILEIEITQDEKTIKKAYAKKVKQYHPEEFPKEWKQIHDAYKSALQYSKTETKRFGSAKRVEILNKDILENNKALQENETLLEDNNFQEDKNSHEVEVVQENEKYVYKDLFQNINEDHIDLSWINEAKRNLIQLLIFRKKSTYHDWQKYLSSSAFSIACHKEEFLRTFREKLKKVELDGTIFNLIIETMNIYEKKFNESSRLHKAIIVHDIIELCRERSNPSYVFNRKMKKTIRISLIIIGTLLYVALSLILVILSGSFS